MKFLCGSCRTKYQISDQKVRGKILTIRCKKCGAKIMVRESLSRDTGATTAVAPVAERTEVEVQSRAAAPAPAQTGGAALAHAYNEAMGARPGESDDMPTSIAPVPANLEMAGVEWYVAIDGEQLGPFAFAEIVRKVSDEQVIGRHYVWHDGMDGWNRVRDIPDLATYLPSEKKKAAPPPPPPAEVGPDGAEVLDLAEKRAERQRQQGLGAPALSGMDADLEQTEVEAADAGVLDRAEQLDDVLNHELGIEGEGKTAQAEPERAVAVAGVAPRGNSSSIDDLLSFDNNQEDIFANVPRASDEPDDPQRESTRFFVAAAGVNRHKSRNRLAMIMGLLMVLGLAAFMGAWATGVVQIRLPGIGNPFQQDEPKPDEYASLDLAPEDAAALKKSLDGIKDPEKRRAIVRKSRRRSKANPAAAPTEYVDDNPSAAGAGTGPRGSGQQGIKFEAKMGTKGGATGNSVGDAKLPGSGIEGVAAPDAQFLSQSAIEGVINSRKKSVSICYEQSLRGREDLRGKLEFSVTVLPTGKVGRVTVESSAFKGSKLGRCIADKIKDWRFPRFEGEPQQVTVPFVLEKHSY